MKINPKNRRTLVESLNADDFKTGAEIGVRTGWFCKYILDNTKMKMYAVDPWEKNAELFYRAEEISIWTRTRFNVTFTQICESFFEIFINCIFSN